MNFKIFKKEQYEEMLKKKEEYIKEAIDNLPTKEIEYCKHVHELIGSNYDDDSIKRNIIFLRYSNPICQKCGNKGPYVKLTLCDKCKLVFYCSEECSNKDSESHKNYCCNKEFDYNENNDLYRLVVLKKK